MACDAFSPPVSFDDLGGTGGSVAPGVFCPNVTFDVVTPASALTKPLFAWLTSEERLAIEAGGNVLPPVAALGAGGGEKLVASMHDSLPEWSNPQHPLVGQPRIGRSFWPFAFSAPRASEQHDELLVIWLRPNAWFTSYRPNFPVVDVSSNVVFNVDFEEFPGRIAGVDTATFSNCYRADFPERGLVVFREEAIERIRFGQEAWTPLLSEMESLQSILTQVRAQSHLNPTMAFDYLSCGDTSSFVLCTENTYVQAIAWPTPEYLPTISALSSLIDGFLEMPVGSSSVIDRTTDAELDAWTAAWPGSWRQPDPGYGGAGGSGGLGGSGG